MAQGFFLWRKKLFDILTAQKAFEKLLDIEYEFILGRKNKNITLRVEFQKAHFFHIAGLQHLMDLPRLKLSTETIYNLLEKGDIPVSYIESSKNYNFIKERIAFLPNLELLFDSNDTIFKYNPALQAFSVIEADFLLKNEIEKMPIFVFLSKSGSGKYFCKSFFPDNKKDYSEGQAKWTVLLKKKILKSKNKETVLYRHRNFNE